MGDRPFNHGDIVVLKSGGPKMTVDRTSSAARADDRKTRCLWFDASGRYRCGFFPDLTLKLPKESQFPSPYPDSEWPR